MSIRRFISGDIAELALMISGGVLVVGAVAYARNARATHVATIDPSKTITKRSTGVSITTPDCRDWSFDDVDDYHATVKPVYDSRTAAGITDPWLITDSVMARVVPLCHTLEQGARNRQEAFLQYVIFIDVITHLRDDGFLNADGFQLAELEIYDYAIEHGVPASAIDQWRNNE